MDVVHFAVKTVIEQRRKICISIVFLELHPRQVKTKENVGYSFEYKLLKRVELSISSSPPPCPFNQIIQWKRLTSQFRYHLSIG